VPSNCCWAAGEPPTSAHSPDFPHQPSLARNAPSPGWPRKGPWPTALPNRRLETTFSRTAGSFPESSTRRSICASTATSVVASRSARAFSLISGKMPARVGAPRCDSIASPVFSRTSKSKHRWPPACSSRVCVGGADYFRAAGVSALGTACQRHRGIPVESHRTVANSMVTPNCAVYLRNPWNTACCFSMLTGDDISSAL
jgi:hypothetical protein